MAYDLRVTDDVKSALSDLATRTDDLVIRPIQQWIDRGFTMPSFGADPVKGGPGETGEALAEAKLLQAKYERQAGTAVAQVSQLMQALKDLALVAGKVRDAYEEAERDQVRALADLTAALTTGLGTVDHDLATRAGGTNS